MNFKRSHVAITLAAVICLLATVSGCSAQSPATRTSLTPRATVLLAAKLAKQAGDTVQFDALKDGKITFDEYHNAFENVDKCYQAAGVSVTAPVINPVDGFSYLFETVGNGLNPAKVQQIQTRCLNKYWTFVSDAYNTITPPKMDEALRAAVMSCLNRKGFPTSANEQDLQELAKIGSSNDTKRQNATTNCVGDEAFKLYPDLPPINLFY